MTKIMREDFEALVRRTGVVLSSDQIAEIYEGWGHIEPMLERIRAPGRDPSVEPSHIFRPDAYDGGTAS